MKEKLPTDSADERDPDLKVVELVAGLAKIMVTHGLTELSYAGIALRRPQVAARELDQKKERPPLRESISLDQRFKDFERGVVP